MAYLANLHSGEAYLQQQGLNLLAVFDCRSESIENLIGKETVEGYRRLVMMANAGPRFWQALNDDGAGAALTEIELANHPIDDFSCRVALHFIEHYLQGSAKILYPGPANPPLQKLGTLAGWHHTSPLGIGIHAQYGLWFAYRVVLLTDVELPITNTLQTDSPCQTCIDKPCVSACPATAVNATTMPDMKRCVDWRLQTDSSCANTCLARLACPVGADYRYPIAQLNYHYQRSLLAMRRV